MLVLSGAGITLLLSILIIFEIFNSRVLNVSLIDFIFWKLEPPDWVKIGIGI